MKKVVLIRHGESVWNKENRFTGWTDVGLSEKDTVRRTQTFGKIFNRWSSRHTAIAEGRLEEAAADHSVLHRQDALAEAVVVPETTLQGPVQLTPSERV